MERFIVIVIEALIALCLLLYIIFKARPRKINQAVAEVAKIYYDDPDITAAGQKK